MLRQIAPVLFRQSSMPWGFSIFIWSWIARLSLFAISKRTGTRGYVTYEDSWKEVPPTVNGVYVHRENKFNHKPNKPDLSEIHCVCTSVSVFWFVSSDCFHSNSCSIPSQIKYSIQFVCAVCFCSWRIFFRSSSPAIVYPHLWLVAVGVWGGDGGSWVDLSWWGCVVKVELTRVKHPGDPSHSHLVHLHCNP